MKYIDTYKITWSTDENHLIIMSDKSVHVINVEDNTQKKEIKHDNKINDIVVIGDNLVVGGIYKYLLILISHFF